MTTNTSQNETEWDIPNVEANNNGEAAAEDPQEAELVSLRLQLGEAQEKMLRSLAEVDNIRKRMQKESADAKRYAASSFAKDMVVILDDLRRSLQAISPEDEGIYNSSAQMFLEGVKMIARSFEGALERQGLTKIEPQVGDKFDPNVHEALFEAKDTGAEPGTIAQVVEIGYMISDRLLRPARVGVGS
jgi:molecular chaperone GrpE